MPVNERARVESDAPGDFVRLMRVDAAQPVGWCGESTARPPRLLQNGPDVGPARAHRR